jgi:5-methylcytosine-specific restriction endonuclease McrA
MRKHGAKAAKWREVRLDWIQKHPGPWTCYICSVPLDIEAHDGFQRLTLDHVLPRSTHPELRYEHANLEPCCWSCNTKKGSMDATSRASKRAYHRKLEDLGV